MSGAFREEDVEPVVALETEGRIRVREVLGLAWPIMVQMLSYTAMSVVDTVFVGRLGTVPLAAVGLATTATFLVHSFGNGLISGGKVAIAQRTGAAEVASGAEVDRHEVAARRLAWQALWFAAVFGVLIAATGGFGPALFSAMGAESSVVALASDYFNVRVTGAPLTFTFLALGAWFHGRGDTRTPMIGAVLANAINVALDPVFIFGWGPMPALGVDGAALTSVVGFGCGVVFLALRARRALSSCPRGPSRALLAELWRLGGPMGVRYLLEVGAFMVFAAVLAHAGTAQLAAHVIVVRIISVSFLPGYATAEAGAILVGQAVGGERPGRAREAWWAANQLALGIMAAFAVVFVVMPDLLLSPFGAEPEVLAIGRTLMLIGAAFQLFDAVAMVSLSALNGAGDTRFAMWSSVLAAWFVKLPVGWALALPLGFGAAGAWVGLTAEIVVIAVVAGWRFHAGRWRSLGPVAAK